MPVAWHTIPRKLDRLWTFDMHMADFQACIYDNSRTTSFSPLQDNTQAISVNHWYWEILALLKPAVA